MRLLYGHLLALISFTKKCIWAVDSFSYLSQWNRSVLKRCIRIPSMFCFLTMMWGCILGRLEPSQKKWRRILRSVFPSTVLPSYCTLCVDSWHFNVFCGWQIFIQTGYPLDLPSGSLGSYCIYEYHMVCLLLIKT